MPDPDNPLPIALQDMDAAFRAVDDRIAYKKARNRRRRRFWFKLILGLFTFALLLIATSSILAMIVQQAIVNP